MRTILRPNPYAESALYQAGRQQLSYILHREHEIKKLTKPEVVSIGGSFLSGEYNRQITPDNLLGMIQRGAQDCAAMGIGYRRRMPMLQREYSVAEQTLIKFSLHTLLALGNEVLVLVVDDADFIERTFGVGNVLFPVGTEVFIGEVGYGGTSNRQRLVCRGDVSVDLLLSDRRLQRAPHVVRSFRLRYDRHSFRTGPDRSSGVSRRYGPLLRFLQGDRCAISGESLEQSAEVDHIVPCGAGGNNTLINLQLINKEVNRAKSDRYHANERFVFSPKDLVRHEFEVAHPYLELSDRKQVSSIFMGICFREDDWRR